MDRLIFKKIQNLFSNYSLFAQKGRGHSDTLDIKKKINLDQYLSAFHSFEVFSYALVDITELKIVKVGENIKQLTGYDTEFFEGKGYNRFLKLHSLFDIYRSISGASKYFKYLYSKEKGKRPYIKANRTLDLYKKSGEKLFVLVQSIPILFNAKAEVILMLVICTDISSLKSDIAYSHFIIDSSDKKQIKRIDIKKSIEDPELNFKPSKAEKRVLNLLSEGLSSKQIAEKLFLSENTIKNHRKNMIKKYGCNNSSGLVKLAVLNGWI
jgi:DNA-binding CsgD family transcriptional regulator